MVDRSSFPELSSQPQTGGNTARGRAGSGQERAHIVQLPSTLALQRTAQRLEGRIQEVRSNNEFVVRTPRGDITLRSDPERPAPQQGQVVEIEIPPRAPGARDIEVQLRPAPQQEQPQPQKTRQHQQTHLRESSTPVRIEVSGLSAQSAPARPDAPPAVRIEPVSLQQVAGFLESAPPALTSSLIESAGFQAQLIALDVQTQALQNFIQSPMQAPIPVETAAAPPLQLQLQPAILQPPGESRPNARLTPLATATTITLHLPDPAALSAAPIAGSPAPAEHPGLHLPAHTALTSAAAPKPAPLPAQIHISAFHHQPPSVQLSEPAAFPLAPEQSIENLIRHVPKPGGAAPQIITAPAQAGSIPAVVITKTPQNLPIIALSLPEGAPDSFNLFAVHQPQKSVLLPGTTLSITPQNTVLSVPSQTAATSLQTAAPPLPAYFMTPEIWPLMNDIQQSLQRAAPVVAQAFTNIAPSPSSPAQMGPAMMFFIAAVRGGDLSQWMGNKALEILERGGRSSTLTRLGQEGEVLGRMVRDSGGQEWRSMSLPLYHDAEFHKIALHYHHDGPRDEQSSEEGKFTRFIFDLSLDEMGPVQLDGLFRGKRLDLILRTQAPFSQVMQMEMRRIYTGALELSQVTGELSFQNRPEQWVVINRADERFGVDA